MEKLPVKAVNTEVKKIPSEETIRNLKEARNYIFLAVSIFAAGILLGLIFPDRFGIFLESFKQLTRNFEGRNIIVLIVMIFFQNCASALLTIWLGSLFGIVPVIGAAVNGILFGVLLSLTIQIGFVSIFWSLVPHGVFEMPALFTAWGLGIWRGTWFLSKRRIQTFRDRGRKAYQVFLNLIVPLLAIAAVIEGIGIAVITAR